MKYCYSFKLLNIKLSENKFFKLFNSSQSEKSNLIHNKSKYKKIVLLAFGVLIGLSIFAIINFTENSEKLESKISKNSESVGIVVSDSPQITQNKERFGDAFSIMPDQIQPGIEEPVLENFDNVQKPLK